MLIGKKCLYCSKNNTVQVGFTSSSIKLFVAERKISQYQRQRRLSLLEKYKPIKICLDCYSLYIHDSYSTTSYDLGYFFNIRLKNLQIVDLRPLVEIAQKRNSIGNFLSYHTMSHLWNGTYKAENSYFWIKPSRNAENAIKFLMLTQNNPNNGKSIFEQRIIGSLSLFLVKKLKYRYVKDKSFDNLAEDSLDYSLLSKFSFDIFGWDISDTENNSGLKNEEWYWGKN